MIKTGGVAAHMRRHSGPARIYESQEDAMSGILDRQVQPGDVVVIRYEGPRGGPGMQEMLSPTSAHHGHGIGREGGADHRRALFRRHARGCASGMSAPKRPPAGPIAALQDGDRIEIDLEPRTLDVA